MKLKILLPILLLCIQSFAQDSSFQLKNYKYRTPGFKALVLDLSLSGNTTRSKISFGGEKVNTNFNLAPGQVAFTKIISTNKRLHQSTFTLLPWAYLTKSKANGEEKRLNQLQSSFRWERNDRFYKNGLRFFEFGNLLDARISDINLKETTRRFKNTSMELRNTFTFGFGKGRIERVQDAQMALFILNDLKAQGLLNNGVTPEVVNSFAQLITDINNRRVFDFRRRRIYEMMRIDSFLQNSGLIQKTDIRHFTTVNDNWSFAINPYRQSGTAWFVRLKPGIGYFPTRYDEQFTAGSFMKFNLNSFLLTITPEIGIEKYVPINLKWQQNMGASFAYQRYRGIQETKSFSQTGTTTSDNTFNGWEAKFTGFFGVGYFPNNRTQLGGNLLTEVKYYNDRSWLLSPELNVFANYFIGYRTYLTANGYFRYDYDHSRPNDNDHILNAGLNVGFSHILF